jgi:hypothetical protein
MAEAFLQDVAARVAPKSHLVFFGAKNFEAAIKD